MDKCLASLLACGALVLIVFAAPTGARERDTPPATASGVVVSPSGERVEGAEVIVCTPNWPAWPNIPPASRAPHRVGGGSTLTDKSGRFNVKLREDTGLLSIHHPKIGYAEVKPDALAHDGGTTVTLEPWCRVEGVLKIGPKPAPAGTKVTLGTFGWTATASRVHYGYDTSTDAEGRYVLDRVPAGLAQIKVRVSATGSPLEQYVFARPQKPVRFDIGGAGRPVVGKLVLEGELDVKKLGKRNGLYSTSHFRRDVPWPQEPPGEIGPPGQEYEDAVREWRKGEQAIEQYKDEYRCEVVFGADGSFRFDDVPPGKYILTINIHRPGGVGQSFEQVVNVKREVVVPIDDPPVPTEQPMDLGEVKVAGEGL